MQTPPGDFLTTLAGMAGAAMTGGPVDFRTMADQFDIMAGVTGYPSLRTLAQGFRELDNDIRNSEVIEHGD